MRGVVSATGPRGLARRLHLCLLALAGCGVTTTRKPPVELFPDMDRQPKYKPQAASPFFSDGRASRRAVPGTVAVGQLRADDAFETGISAGMYIGRNPLADRRRPAGPRPGALRHLLRGLPRPHRQRQGHRPGARTVLAADQPARRAHSPDDRRRTVQRRHVRPPHHARLPLPGLRQRDRWAIVAYVRALQRAGQGTLEDVPPELRRR